MIRGCPAGSESFHRLEQAPRKRQLPVEKCRHPAVSMI